MHPSTEQVETSFSIGVWYCTFLGMFVALVAETPEEVLSMRESLDQTKLPYTYVLDLLHRPGIWVATHETEAGARARLLEIIEANDPDRLNIAAETAFPQLANIFLEITGHEFHY